MPIEEANSYGWSQSQGTPTGTTVTAALEEMALALANSDIELEMYHSEGAPGQYEFVVGHLPPMEAADALVSTRETVYNIAAKHGMRATLAPRLRLDGSMYSSLSKHQPPG